MKRLMLATIASVTLLAGCGPTMAQHADAPWSVQNAQRFHGAGMLRGLNLTAEQQSKIKAILKAHRPHGDRAGREQGAALKDLLLAPQVDSAKLTEALNSRFGRQEAHLDRFVTLLAELREVLTPEQRAKLAEWRPQERKAGGKHGKWGGKGKGHGVLPFERLTKDLNLTADQQKTVDELKAAFAANREARKDTMAKRHEALAAFARTGDRAALKASLQALQPEMPVEAIVKVASSLSLEQRQQIAERMSRRHGRFGAWRGKKADS